MEGNPQGYNTKKEGIPKQSPGFNLWGNAPALDVLAKKVFMITREDRQRFKQLDREQTQYEAAWQPQIEAAITAQLRPFMQALRANGPAYALSNINDLILPDPMADVLGRLWASVGTHAANSQWGYFQRVYGPEIRGEKRFGFNRYWSSILSGLFSVFGGRRIVSITNTERERVRRELEEYAQNRDLTNYELAQRLESSQIPKKRSNVIARTETGTAASAGADAAARRTGFLMIKTWLSTLDNRTRHLPEDQADHRRMNGIEVGMDDKFVVPSKSGIDLMSRPHDPEAPAYQTIQCRCKATYKAARDASGRLIRTTYGDVTRPVGAL